MKGLKVISVFIAAVLAMGTFCTGVAASESDFYIKDGVLLKYTGTASSVTVPSEVYYIGESAFAESSVKEVVLQKNVVYIGDNAFYNCSELSKISFDENVRSIGANAFYDTPWLNNRTEDVVAVNKVIVKYNGSASSYTIPTYYNAIAGYAFAENQTLKSVIVPSSVNEIGEGAFSGCTALNNVSLPDTISDIGLKAFYGTGFIKNYSGDYLVVGNGILINCKLDVENAVVPNGVRQIGAGAFLGM